MGGGSGGGGDNTARYAPYVEDYHKTFLGVSESYGDDIRVPSVSPYIDYEKPDYDNFFFGALSAATYSTGLFELFGDYISGVDLDTLFREKLSVLQNDSSIADASSAHNALLTDEIEQDALPRFYTGMRDVNAVMSSTFIIGKSLIEQGKVKQVAKFDADLRYKLIPLSVDLFAKQLSWNQTVIDLHHRIIAAYINTEEVITDKAYDFNKKDLLWPFTVLAQERANLGALQGAVTQSTEGEGPSQTQQTLGGVMGGAAAGATVGGPPGAVVGGVIGGIASFL